MRLFIIVMLFTITAGLFDLGTAFAQTDPIETAKTYPPQLLQKGENETNLATIKWRIELQQNLLDRNERKHGTAVNALKVFSKKLEELNMQLPAEVRFVDQSVRSQLIGKTMEELLVARLDLASLESQKKQLVERLAKNNEGKRAKLIKRQADIRIKAASSKVKVAQTEFEHIQKLTAKGSKSNRDELMARYTLEIAKLELESAMVRAEVESVEQNSEIAQQLTAARIADCSCRKFSPDNRRFQQNIQTDRRNDKSIRASKIRR